LRTFGAFERPSFKMGKTMTRPVLKYDTYLSRCAFDKMRPVPLGLEKLFCGEFLSCFA
jgi:hypothetical protein